MSNYVIKFSSGRLCDMCVCVWEEERERERGRYTMNNKINGGGLTILKSIIKLRKYPQSGIYTTHVQGCTCASRI